MMRQHILRERFIAMLIVGSAMSGGIVRAGPYEDATAAYDRGDYSGIGIIFFNNKNAGAVIRDRYWAVAFYDQHGHSE